MKTTTEQQIIELLTKKNEQAIIDLLRSGFLHPNKRIVNPATQDQFQLLPRAIELNLNALSIFLIKNGGDLDQYSSAYTPLMIACAACNHQVISALIAAGADLNSRAKNIGDSCGETALMLAAAQADIVTVKQLLKAGADPKAVTRNKQTAIYYATRYAATQATPSAIKIIAQAGCPLLGNELHAPVYRRESGIVKTLLELRCPTDVPFLRNEIDGPKKGETPLTTAVGLSPLDLLEFMDPPERTAKAREEIVRLLLAGGANPNLPNAKGATPLMLAVRGQELKLAKILVQSGAHPAFVPSKSRFESPLILAEKKKLSKFVELLKSV